MLWRHFLLTLLMIQTSEGFAKQLSFYLKPHENECFYQWFTKDLKINIDYTVNNGDKFVIDTAVQSPSKKKLFNDIDRQHGDFQLTADETGPYSLCFFNKDSAVKKISFSEYVFENVDNESKFIDPTFPVHQLLPSKYQVARDELAKELEKSFRRSVEKVAKHLLIIERMQLFLKAYEDIDEFLMHSKLGKVNFLSTVSIFLMIFVALIQVVLIRSLFEYNSKLGRVLRK